MTTQIFQWKKLKVYFERGDRVYKDDYLVRGERTLQNTNFSQTTPNP